MNNNTVRLRALEPEDVDLLYELENDAQLWVYSDVTAPFSRAVLHQFIDNNANDIYQDQQLRLVIEIDGQPAGCADLFHFNPSNRRAEVGIALLSRWRTQGYGAEALRQLIAFANDNLSLTQLYAIVTTDNASALALFATCGFQESGRLLSWVIRGKTRRDAVFFQLLFEQS